MKNGSLLLLIFISILLSGSVFSQTAAKKDTLGLPGDNLDLYAVLDLFQKSKTIEDFEKSLNLEKTAINNLDLNLDKKVDFIKVVTKKNGEDFTFILQDAVSEKETQDVAVILVSKDKNKKVTMQIVGDPALYGKNYIVEPKAAAPAATVNPGYTGTDPVKAPAPVNTTTTVVVESSPVVVYMYSPAYVPYVPPYHYAYYPPYFAAVTVMAVGVYHANHYNNYYHGGGYGNTTVVVNNNNYNNYNNNSRNTSNTVNHNNANGNYNGNNANNANRPANTSGNTGNKPANTSGNTGNKPANTGGNTGNKPSNTSGNKPSANPSASPSARPSASPSVSPSFTPKSGSGRSGSGGGQGRRR